MRLRPTHYTITSQKLKSWVIDGSLDGQEWTEIDRNPTVYGVNGTESFAFKNSVECRFIRLTQKDMTAEGETVLELSAFEVFGSLLEWHE
jgi:hypothetical protein